jgi:hypothetical protein
MAKGNGDFYTSWQEKRKKKWQYVFLHGTVYLGLTLGILMFLLKNNFQIERMHYPDFIEKIITSVITGFVIVLLDFNRRDKIYLNGNLDILNGIKTLKEGRVWKYENLRITNVNNETLVVRNKLFWFDKKDDQHEKTTECFHAVVEEYQQLKKDKGFEKFSKGYKVRAQIFEVMDNETPIIDREIV